MTLIKPLFCKLAFHRTSVVGEGGEKKEEKNFVPSSL